LKYVKQTQLNNGGLARLEISWLSERVSLFYHKLWRI